MPNGGSDCCGNCWFNRSLVGQRGSKKFNLGIPSYCEIRDLGISSPFFYTYCANHPYYRLGRDPIPIGPVYCHSDADRREEWQPSPEPSPDRLGVNTKLAQWIRLFQLGKDMFAFRLHHS